MNLKEILRDETNIIKMRPSILDSNMYLIGHTLIDTGTGLNKELYKKELITNNKSFKDVQRVLLTHEHYDHIGGLKLSKNAKVLAHKNTSHILFQEHPRIFHDYYRSNIHRKRADVELKHNDKLRISDLKFNVIHTPEHSLGSICLYNKDKGILFSGDLIPRQIHDHYIYNKEPLVQRLNKLNKMNIETIYPGHGKIINYGNEYIAQKIDELERIND